MYGAVLCFEGLDVQEPLDLFFVGLGKSKCVPRFVLPLLDCPTEAKRTVEGLLDGPNASNFGSDEAWTVQMTLETYLDRFWNQKVWPESALIVLCVAEHFQNRF